LLRDGDGCAATSTHARSAASHTPAAAILCRRRQVRFGVLCAQLVVPFDANDGENDDGGGLFRRVNAAEADDAPLIGEFDNGAHVGGPAVVRFLLGSGPPARCTRIGLCE